MNKIRCKSANLVEFSRVCSPRQKAPRPSPQHALFEAVKANDVDAMHKAVAAGAKIEAWDTMGNTPLMWAVSASKFAAAKWLIERKADPNNPKQGGSWMLSTACRSRPQTDDTIGLIDLLLDHKADIDRIHYATTPLMDATFAACDRHVELLLKRKADATIQTFADTVFVKKTALDIAKERGLAQIVDLLSVAPAPEAPSAPTPSCSVPAASQ